MTISYVGKPLLDAQKYSAAAWPKQDGQPQPQGDLIGWTFELHHHQIHTLILRDPISRIFSRGGEGLMSMSGPWAWRQQGHGHGSRCGRNSRRQAHGRPETRAKRCVQCSRSPSSRRPAGLCDMTHAEPCSTCLLERMYICTGCLPDVTEAHQHIAYEGTDSRFVASIRARPITETQ